MITITEAPSPFFIGVQRTTIYEELTIDSGIVVGYSAMNFL